MQMTRISSAEAGPSRPIHDMGKSLFWEKKVSNNGKYLF